MKKKIFLIVSIVTVVALLLVLFNIEKIKLMKDGLRYQLYNSNYTLSNKELGYDIDFKVDKENLNNNINKVIYEDSKSYIKIDDIHKTSSQYIIYFSSHGYCEDGYGYLVTGVNHTVLPTREAQFTINAKCYVGDINCSYYSVSDINFKDGDEFSFAIDSEVFENENNDYFVLKDLLILELVK